MILDNAHVEVETVDLSAYVREVTVDESVSEVENRTMGKTAASVKGGTPQWTITVKFLQDFGAALVHATLRPLVGRNDVDIKVRVDKDDAISATNPQWEGTAFFGRYVPISGAPGSQQEPVAEFKNAGTTLTYKTAP